MSDKKLTDITSPPSRQQMKSNKVVTHGIERMQHKRIDGYNKSTQKNHEEDDDDDDTIATTLWPIQFFSHMDQ